MTPQTNMSQTPIFDEMTSRYAAARARLIGASVNKNNRIRLVADREPVKAPVEPPVQYYGPFKRDWLDVSCGAVTTLEPDHQVTAKSITEYWCARFKITKGQAISHARYNPLPACRAFIMSDIHEKLGWSLARVGKYMGGRDHSTVIHALKCLGEGKYNSCLSYWSTGYEADD